MQFPGGQQIGIFVAMTFVLGIVMIFLYAGLRPRFGAGVGTAVIAALIIWIVGIMAAMSDVVIGLTPGNLVALAGTWSLVETIVAAIAGAWVYKRAPDRGPLNWGRIYFLPKIDPSPIAERKSDSAE